MKIKKIVALLAIPGLFTFAGCSMLNNAQKNVQTVINDVKDSFEIDSNGHFKEEKKYDINGSIEGTESLYSYNYIFKTNGDVECKDLAKDKSETYTYTVNKNLIIIDEGEYKTYIDYFEDVIVVPIETHINGDRMYLGCVCGNLSGVAVSQRSKSTLGYHIELNVNVGDLPAVLTGKSTSKGNYIKIYKNGTIYSKSSGEYYYSYINSDQVVGFDTTKEGEYIVDVTISKVVYKAVLRVKATQK